MKVGIVGLGLIGGSLGLELRSQGIKVLGVSRGQQTCQIALELGVADRAQTDLSLLTSADLVFVCTPLAAIVPTVEQLIPHLQPQTIITDVGSVKTPIVEACTRLWSTFVGGHPMAGTAQQGIEAAQLNLFRDAAYVLTPTATTPSQALTKVEEIARSLGSQVSTCSPQAHDRAVAGISHLPVMISAALIAACSADESAPLAQRLASSGFRDTSRVGGGNPSLGVQMARYNRSQLLRSLLQYRQNLDHIIAQIEQENWDTLEEILQSTQQARPQFLK